MSGGYDVIVIRGAWGERAGALADGALRVHRRNELVVAMLRAVE